MKFILASTSPRRIELLKQVGFQFDCLSPQCDETPLKRESAARLVSRLSLIKARSVAGHFENQPESHLIISADTVVALKGKILGKPESRQDAERMLTSLSNQTHTVFTGYCLLLLTPGKRSKSFVRVCSTRVKIRKLNTQMIQRYIATGEPMDKAGAYAAQGLGMAFIESIQGSYSNVVGLPLAQVVLDLETKFGHKFFKS